jgi:hypothetical protein
MPNKEMPKEVSIMGGGPMFGMSQHLVNLARAEAAGTKKPSWLRSQKKRWAMAKRAKKGFEEIARAVCYLRRRAKKAGGDSQRLEVCRPSRGGSPAGMALGGRTHGPKPSR